jgi:hypothetical protein
MNNINSSFSKMNIYFVKIKNHHRDFIKEKNLLLKRVNKIGFKIIFYLFTFIFFIYLEENINLIVFYY